MIDKKDIGAYFRSLQDSICKGLEEEDKTGKFREDLWQHKEKGGGRSRVLENGSIIKKGGVNFSEIEGTLPDKITEALKVNEKGFYVAGVSIVIHPENPFVPIIHMNVRYFELNDGTYWFGGGIDLTPHYINKDQAKHFHTKIKSVCDKFSPDFYPQFKKWADDYFFLQHRHETRGVGGIFFDRLNEGTYGKPKEVLFEFVKSVGEMFLPAYTYQIRENSSKAYTEDHVRWRNIRRSRYVEFNLLFDRGTKFGLDTDGRIESILMSMPPLAEWFYNYQPEQSTKEYETLQLLKKGIDWININ